VEWPKKISKFFSRQKLASISQVGFRVINIPSLGVFYKNGCCGGCLTCEELVGITHRGWLVGFTRIGDWSISFI